MHPNEPNPQDKALESLGLAMHAPHSELSPYIQCYWSISREKELPEELTRKIVSDGGMGVVFNYGGALRVQMGKENAANLSGCFITGPTMNATYLTLEGKINAIGIRFRPGGALPFVQGDVNTYRDTVLPSSADHESVWNGLYGKLQKKPMTADRIRLLDDFLMEALSRNKPAMTDWLLEVIQTMWSHKGSIRIDELCTNMNISQRQFERNFKKAVGLLPKQISRIIRIDRSRAMIRSLEFDSLTEIGHACEFFDQAHFINEFKKIVETTPGDYFEEKKNMSNFSNS